MTKEFFPGDLVRFYHDPEALGVRPVNMGSSSNVFCWTGDHWKRQHVYGDETFVGNVLAVPHWTDIYEKNAFASRFVNVFSRETFVLIVDVITLRQELLNDDGVFVHVPPKFDEMGRFKHSSIVLLTLDKGNTYTTVEAIR